MVANPLEESLPSFAIEHRGVNLVSARRPRYDDLKYSKTWDACMHAFIHTCIHGGLSKLWCLFGSPKLGPVF